MVYTVVLLVHVHFITAQVPGTLTAAYKITTVPAASLNLIPGVVPRYGAVVYYIGYTTINPDGLPVNASGALMLPLTDTCNYFPLVSFQHGTVLYRYDVPSRNNNEAVVGQLFASQGFAACMPDYLGMGDSPGFHPYLHAASEATATLDLIRACRAFMTDSLHLNHNGQLFLGGYSQGGHATMATHKYIEDNNLTGTFNVVASAPGAGPYHLSGAQADMVFLNPAYPRQGYIVYMIYGWNSVYHDLFAHPSDIFKAPWDSIIPPLMDGFSGMNQLNNVLPDSLHEYISDSVYQLIMDHYTKNHVVWQHLQDNDNHDWKPSAPVRMLYCEADEQVSYLNSVNALQAMLQNGATDVEAINLNPSGTHGSCALPALAHMIQWFNALKTDCYNPTALAELFAGRLLIAPNPVSQLFVIESPCGTKAELVNLQGRVERVYDLKAGHNTIGTGSLKPGVYVVRMVCGRVVYVGRLVVL